MTQQQLNNNHTRSSTTTEQSVVSKGCPFAPRRGYSTNDSRRDWIRQQQQYNKNGDDMLTTAPESLQADPDTTRPLYFWQLYSLIGHEPVLEITHNFYERVFCDTNDQQHASFARAFTRIGSAEYHARQQAAYWIDAMGGGKLYHGGNHRLRFHHQHNAASVMNAAGAKRWIFHMRGSLNAFDFASLHDSRVKPCILSFLKSRMEIYAAQHDWEFNEQDFCGE